MQVKAVYDHGKLELLESVEFKHERLHVVVDFPDDEVVGIKVQKTSINEELNAILGGYRKGNNMRSPAEDKAIWHAHLEDKYG